jgi:hypothetical protein
MSRLGTVSNVPIATVAVAYNCPSTFTTYILILNQVLYMKELTHALISPNQLRFNGATVNEVPLSFVAPKDQNQDCHSIITTNLRILLKVTGVISYFECHCPSMQEMNDDIHYPKIEMMLSGVWDPNNIMSGSDEDSLRAAFIRSPMELNDSRLISGVTFNWGQCAAVETIRPYGERGLFPRKS